MTEYVRITDRKIELTDEGVEALVSDYTPTTEEVRSYFRGSSFSSGEQFDRWLAEVKAQAVEKAANRESDWRSGYWRPAEAETVVKIRKGLLKHAQRIRQGEEQ